MKEVIGELLKQEGHTQKTMCVQIGLAYTTFNINVRTGTLKFLKKVCDALGWKITIVLEKDDKRIEKCL